MANHRPGHITASTVSRFLTGKDPAKLLKGTETACMELALERLGICPDLAEYGFTGNTATDWGNEHEAEAIEAYKAETFTLEVHGQQDVIRGGEWLSCTPDGLIGSIGMLETKCPFNPHKHFAYAIDPTALEDEYFDQVQFQLWLSGRKWCDLTSYDPRFIEGHRLVIARIEPNAKWQEFAQIRIELVLERVQRIFEQFNSNQK
jgi:hypothetical protein